MSLHSDTLSWFWANRCLLFLLDAACLMEKQEIPILQSLSWPDGDSNLQSAAIQTNLQSAAIQMSTLTITPPVMSHFNFNLDL